MNISQSVFKMSLGFVVAFGAGTALAENADLVPSLAGMRTIASAKSTPAVKKELVARLRNMKSQCDDELGTVDEQMKKLLIEVTKVHLDPAGLESDHRHLEQITSQIDVLNRRRADIYAKREIYDRMTFAVDSKWTSQPLSAFFESQFMEMATSDLSEISPDKSNLWKTFLYLSVAVREIPEKHEDIVNVIEGYLNFAGADDPKTPSEYLANRSYTNGKESIAARPSLLFDGKTNDKPSSAKGTHAGYEAGTVSGATTPPQAAPATVPTTAGSAQ